MLPTRPSLRVTSDDSTILLLSPASARAQVAESQSQLQGLKVHVSKTTANAVTIVDETSARVASSTEEMADGLQSQSDGHGQGIVRVVANGRLMCDAVATHSGGASARLSDATKATRQ